MKTWDGIIIGIVAALSLLPLLLLPRVSSDAQVTVTVRGEIVYSGRMDEDAVVAAGAGNTVIIAGGHVRMQDADCPDGVCLRGEATAAHPLVCLPNGVVVSIAGGEAAYDGLSY